MPGRTSPTRGPRRGARAQPRSLLDLVPGLDDGLPSEGRAAARAATPVQTAAVPLGPWSPSSLVGEDGGIGFLLADGLVVRDVLIAGSVASDLLGPGDVAALGGPEDSLVPARVRWTVSAPARVAVIDARLLASLEAWPQVIARLLARATRQTSTMALQRAISQLPRVDQRLVALFWHLADRWGRVAPDGIVVRLALTHETLGRMVGARRPTVSLALKELARAGTIARRPDGAWVLRPDGLERLSPAGASWQPPDATVLPDLAAAPAPAGESRERLRLLDAS